MTIYTSAVQVHLQNAFTQFSALFNHVSYFDTVTYVHGLKSLVVYLSPPLVPLLRNNYV